MFKLNYFKTRPLNLETLEKEAELTPDDINNNYNPFKIKNLQHYNPVYNKYFSLNENTYNKIALNHKYHFSTLSTIFDQETKEICNKPVFIKYSPLLDPVRYMIGKYKDDGDSIYSLPKITDVENTDAIKHTKLFDENNASYIDNFFSFLTSKLLNHHQFIHGLDYYGSMLGVQEKFKFNVTDDLEYLHSSPHFSEYNNKLFSITMSEYNEFMNFGSRTNKNKLQITDNIENIECEVLECENLDIIEDQREEQNNNSNPVESIVYENNKSRTESSDNSSSNSETNYSTDSDKEEGEGEHDSDDDSSWETEEDENENEDEDDDDCTDESEDCQFAYINNFPVQLICLEKCTGTLDALFVKDKVDQIEAASILMQIIMILISYQKAFQFTHNDLHTNNIMYVNTDVEYLFYKYNKQIYKVPTYGKIYKIIDFGRSIYRFNGQHFCSDSFANGGDAATQYNCEPYMNEKKPRLDPNYSFDLCRLGCAIYDFIIDNDEHPEQFDELQKTIYRWCLDDKQKNILYKKNGDERYPNFKLYKMIARTVHNHTPQEQLEFPYFKQFLLESKLVDDVVLDIDALPIYV